MVSGLFVFLLLNFKDSLYILDSSSLSDVSYTNIFSQSAGCLLVSCTVSFAVQKLMSLIKYHLYIFAFISIAWGE